MKKYEKKITRSIQQDPVYDSLGELRHGVWQRIRDTRVNEDAGTWFNFTLTPTIKACSFVLLLGSCLALSQISFEKGIEPDLFDLRYFSHQSLTTTNLLSMNDQGLLP
ncbi:MAG: hypothetical protein ACI8ZB_001425 [Desulforhopalus sp.]|jgi:hypothetical protein